ncbi:MAG: sensor histidine kinase [Fibrobacterota bacterium]
MNSFFASPERSDETQIHREITTVSSSPVVSELLRVMKGVFAVLDRNRQIVGVNTSLLDLLGVPDSEDILGLRVGEAFHCHYEHEAPAGCGTGKMCRSCGAAVATVAALADNENRTEKCVIDQRTNGQSSTIILEVSSHPIMIQNTTYVLLFLHDITASEYRASLENAFFHDMGNHLNGVVGAAELLSRQETDSHITRLIQKSVDNLHNEFSIQKSLMHNSAQLYQAKTEPIQATTLLKHLTDIYTVHRAAENKNIAFDAPERDCTFYSDFSLVSRIAGNMITNALEATLPGETVRVSASRENNHVRISVWNRKKIPDDIQPRIFQNRFSTKPGEGRGIGTYSMKLFGEDVLHGTVSFTSTEQEGTTFYLLLPL